MSKELIERLRWRSLPAQRPYQPFAMLYEAADLIEQLQREVVESLHAQDICHQHLLGEMQEQLAAAQGQRNASNRKIEELTDQLAAAQAKIAEHESALMNSGLIIESLQAREAKLRETLEEIAKHTWIAAKEALSQTEVK